MAAWLPSHYLLCFLKGQESSTVGGLLGCAQPCDVVPAAFPKSKAPATVQHVGPLDLSYAVPPRLANPEADSIWDWSGQDSNLFPL